MLMSAQLRESNGFSNSFMIFFILLKLNGNNSATRSSYELRNWWAIWCFIFSLSTSWNVIIVNSPNRHFVWANNVCTHSIPTKAMTLFSCAEQHILSEFARFNLHPQWNGENAIKEKSQRMFMIVLLLLSLYTEHMKVWIVVMRVERKGEEYLMAMNNHHRVAGWKSLYCQSTCKIAIRHEADDIGTAFLAAACLIHIKMMMIFPTKIYFPRLKTFLLLSCENI